MKPKITVIIISNHCPEHIKKTLNSLQNQTKKPHQTLISSSIHETLKKVDLDSQYILFLNPDVILTDAFLESALHFMENSSACGAMTGLLLEYDLEKNEPTGRYNSTGIFYTPYGKWFDRDQGQEINTHLYKTNEELPAINEALFLCRKKALLTPDNSYIRFKDYIDLSITIRKNDWKLMLVPNLIAYHSNPCTPKHLTAT